MFKSYTSNDNLLLPTCLGDFIPQNDPVRVVHRIIEQTNLEELYRKYSPKGCSAYHPRMMFQILVYAYLRNIYLYAFKHGIETFIKYNYFHKEQKRSFRNDPFLSFYYNEETNGVYCRMGQRIEFGLLAIAYNLAKVVS